MSVVKWIIHNAAARGEVKKHHMLRGTDFQKRKGVRGHYSFWSVHLEMSQNICDGINTGDPPRLPFPGWCSNPTPLVNKRPIKQNEWFHLFLYLSYLVRKKCTKHTFWCFIVTVAHFYTSKLLGRSLPFSLCTFVKVDFMPHYVCFCWNKLALILIFGCCVFGGSPLIAAHS